MTEAYSQKTLRLLVLSGIALFGILEIGIIYFCFPKSYTHYMLSIPVYFLLLGIVVLWFLSRICRKGTPPENTVTKLMALNLVQLFLSFAVLFYYVYKINVKRIAFLVAFGLFYLFFLVVKSCLIIDANRKNGTLPETKGGTA